MTLEELINRIDSLSESDLILIEYILTNKSKVSQMKATELSKETYVSISSVTRLSQKLGFAGFSELKYFLRNEIESVLTTKSSSWNLLKEDLLRTVNIIEDSNYTKYSQLINESSRVFVYATDWGERKAANLFIRNFMSVGIYMTIIPSITELRWVTENSVVDDLFIIISYSGSSQELSELSKILSLKKVKTISVTPLTKNNLSLIIPNNIYYIVTPLNGLSPNPLSEYNMFTTLHVVLDAVFRNYLEFKHNISKT